MVKIVKLLKIMGINLVILLVLLKLVDLFIVGKPPYVIGKSRIISVREVHPNSDFTVMPSDAEMAVSENLIQKPYRIRSDANGFIIGPNDLVNKSDSLDIIFFGGSTTKCEYVDEEKRFPYLVGEILSSKTGKKINVRNAGEAGKNTMQSTLNLMSKGAPLQPKIVVLMHAVNDLTQLTLTGSYWDGPAGRNIAPFAPQESVPFRIFQLLKDTIFPNIYLQYLQSLFVDFYVDRNGDEWQEFRDFKDFNYYDLEEQYTRTILGFIRLARTYNIEVVLMTQFNRINLNDPMAVKQYNKFYAKNPIDYNTYVDFYTRFTEKIRDIAIKENVFLIDLADRIPSSSDYIYDAVHLNNEGSVLAAKIIAEKIEAEFYQQNH